MNATRRTVAAICATCRLRGQPILFGRKSLCGKNRPPDSANAALTFLAYGAQTGNENGQDKGNVHAVNEESPMAPAMTSIAVRDAVDSHGNG